MPDCQLPLSSAAAAFLPTPRRHALPLMLLLPPPFRHAFFFFFAIFARYPTDAA